MTGSRQQEQDGGLLGARRYASTGAKYRDIDLGGEWRETGRRSIKVGGGWVWIPLSFIFLLVGTVLGFQVAISVRSQITNGPKEDPYALNLTATPSAESVHLRWDRDSVPVRLAQKGVLLIVENGSRKAVDLDTGHLRHGSVIYRRFSDDVKFRLEVYVNDQMSVTETLPFRLPKSPAPQAGKP
jgi:hypothetical protein